MATPETINSLPFDQAIKIICQDRSEEDLKKIRTAARSARTKSRTKLRLFREHFEEKFPEPSEEQQAEFDQVEASLVLSVQVATEYLRRVEYAFDVKAEVISCFHIKKHPGGSAIQQADDPGVKPAVPDLRPVSRELSPMSERASKQRAPQLLREDIYPDDSASQAHIGKSVLPKIRARDPSKVKLSDLNRASDLRNHIMFAELAFKEAGLGTYVNSKFIVNEGVRVAVLTNFLSSMKDATVKLSADHAVRSTNFCWHMVMDTLISRFCRPEVMRMEFERQLSKLQFNGPSRVDEFIQQAIVIYQSCTTVYNDQSECKSTVRSIFKKLPSGLREKLITRVYLESAISCDDEWELALSFDISVSTSMGKSLCDCLRDICRIEELAYMASSNTQQQFKAHNQQFDRVKYTASRLKPSDFAQKHSVVLYMGGPGLRNNDETRRLLSKIPSQSFYGRNGKIYYLLGFKDRDTADSFRSNVGQGYAVRDHEPYGGRSAPVASDKSVAGTPPPKN
jgi:hypothetical protein